MELDIKDILSIIKKGIVLIIVLTLLGAVLMGTYTYLCVSPKYTATAKMYVYNERSASTQYISSSDLTVSKSLVDTYLIIIKSRPVVERSREILIQMSSEKYSGITVEEIQRALGGKSIDETETFTVTATTTDPAKSADIVNAVILAAPDGIKEIVKGASASVIEDAIVPQGASWPLMRNVVLGAAVGMVIALVVVFLKTFLDKTIHGYSDFSKNFELPVIGIIPVNKDAALGSGSSKKSKKENAHAVAGSKLIVSEKTPFSVIEAYRAARTNVFYLPIEDNCKKVAFTSSEPGEGKTVNSINMATLLAQAGKKVVLIDADMRKPKVRTYLQVKATSGLSEYLAGIVEKPEIIRHQGGGFDVILSGNPSTSPAELMATAKMASLFEELEKNYDYVLVDTPPVNYVTDAAVMSKHVNGYIFSVRAGYSNIDHINNALGALDKVGANICGVMMVGIDPKVDSYGRYAMRGRGDYERAYAVGDEKKAEG